MEALLAFAAALLALRLAGDLFGRWRARRAAARGLVGLAPGLRDRASAALCVGRRGAAGTTGLPGLLPRGGLLTASLLGVGSLLLSGRRWAAPVGFVYAGLAVGIALAVPLTSRSRGTAIPEAQAHLDFWPARILAILGNSLGTLAVVVIALSTIRRRPLGNVLILAGVAVAAAGSAVAGLGAAPRPSSSPRP